MDTLDLFASDVGAKLENKHAISPIAIYRVEPADQRAMRRIEAVLRDRRPCVGALSSGKDSSTLASLLLLTARKLKEEGEIEVPPIMFVSSDTGVEHPQVARLIRADHERIRNYAMRHGLNVLTRITKPRLADTFPARIIGGRALPSFPDGNSDCSTVWKIELLGPNSAKTAAGKNP
jgi:DNA sulfur modification protein DndC